MEGTPKRRFYVPLDTTDQEHKSMDNSNLPCVPREDWQAFLDGWSREHEGDLIKLSGLLGDEAALDLDSPRLHLVGISLDPRGSEAGHLIIMMGQAPGNNHEHILADITQVHARFENEMRNISHLEFNRANGSVVSVQASEY
jgi:hypothetical protein